MYTFDQDDDAKISPTELLPLLEQLKQGHEQSAVGDQLTAPVVIKMADGDSDGYLSQSELVDLLLRMKGYDGGHLSQNEANTPAAELKRSADYGKSHEERVRLKKKKKKKKKAAAAKDEV